MSVKTESVRTPVCNCPHIPCVMIANKIDLDPRTTKRSYKFIEDLKVPFNFVSAADGTNVV